MPELTTVRTAVELTARMYKSHEAAKTLFAGNYEEKVKWYKINLERCCKDLGCDTMEALVTLCNMDSVKDNGVVLIMFLAAAVELIEEQK